MATYVEELASFLDKVGYGDLDKETVYQLKLRILDSIGCQLAALDGPPTKAVRAQVAEFGGDQGGRCTLIGGGKSSPDYAAFYNGALLRYVDFMDNYMGKKQSGHPSDNLAPVLAASEYANRKGKEFLTALGMAYGVFIKLLDDLPVEAKDFDHTVQLAYSMTAGISKALGMDKERTANALAISGAAFQGLVATRSGYVSQWKGLASSLEALGVMNPPSSRGTASQAPCKCWKARTASWNPSEKKPSWSGPKTTSRP